MSMMNIERFDELASAYGAAISLWPADDQAAGKALAAASPEAEAILARERALDAALDTWEVPMPSEALMARVLGDAAAVGITPAPAPPPRAAPAKRGFFSRFFGDIGWRPAGAMTACLAIGFVAGMSGAPAPMETATQTAQVEEDNAVLATFFGEDDDSDPFDLEML